VRNEPEWQRALVQGHPQLVVLDDGISPGNGLRLLSALRQRLPEALTIYLAEQHSPELEKAARRLGVLYYTEKPPEWEAFKKVLTAALPLPPPSTSLQLS